MVPTWKFGPNNRFVSCKVVDREFHLNHSSFMRLFHFADSFVVDHRQPHGRRIPLCEVFGLASPVANGLFGIHQVKVNSAKLFNLSDRSLVIDIVFIGLLRPSVVIISLIRGRLCFELEVSDFESYFVLLFRWQTNALKHIEFDLILFGFDISLQSYFIFV